MMEVKNSADLPIEIGDEEVGDIIGVKKPPVGRQTRRDTRIQENDLLLCEFPPGESTSVAVTFTD